MFSLLAIVVTVLLLGSAMLWRGVCALSRSRFRPRAIRRPLSRGGSRGIERNAVARSRLQPAETADGPVASAGVPRRW
jgi:hypothetical protein